MNQSCPRCYEIPATFSSPREWVECEECEIERRKEEDTMKTIYLAGPINGCTDDECKTWRESAENELAGFAILDPMRRDYRGAEHAMYREIVEDDKADIDASDVLLVNHPKPSVGTAMEVLYAWERGKVIVVVTPAGAVVSPWLRYHTTEIVQSFAEAYALLRERA